jgi:crotonobetainyl-CoA:carnitine CoA-transferase CaiB-like acyl-CoA transferase
VSPPLEGIRVLDLSQAMSGPYASMMLADAGAEVIKLEPPDGGDHVRSWLPGGAALSPYLIAANRSKRSVTIDLKQARGVEIALELARRSDIFLENFRPGVAARLGVGYDAVKAVRPDVIYCSISGFGQTGPYRDRSGFDIMAQGAVGLMRMTGEPGGRPVKVGIAINDIAAGATAIYSILAAELARRATGAGQYIDISLVDAGLAWTVWESGAYFGSGETPAPTGTRHRRSTPYQAYRTSDGFVTIGANTERLWTRLVNDVLKRPDWADDPRFVDLTARMAHIDELEVEIEAITTTLPTSAWMDRLDSAGVPGGPVLTYDEALDDPHVLERGMVVDVEHPIIGPMKTIAPPTHFSNLEFSVRSPAPWLGQHTASVLSELGVDGDELDRLFTEGTLYDAHPELQGGHR